MKLPQICISRPVFTIVLSLVLILLGIMSFQQLQVRYQPKVFKPRLNVVAEYPGATAKQVEINITDKLENKLSDVAHLHEMYSTSSLGRSHIKMIFDEGISEEEFVTAQSQVLQAVASTTLPEAALKPQVYQADQGQNTLAILGVSSTKMDTPALQSYVDNYIAKPLQQVNGVAQVFTMSGAVAIRIALHPSKLAAYHLSASQVKQALEDNSVAISTGQLLTTNQIIPVSTTLTLPNVTAYRNLLVANVQGQPVRLGQLANIFVGERSIIGEYSRVNGHTGVVMQVASTDTANPIEVGKRVKAKIALLRESLPTGTKITIVSSLSKPLAHAVHEVFFTIFEAIILVLLVTYLFLGTLRATLIPVVTIPVCLISSFALMFFMGFSINILTLLALVLAVGLVVDDAIVMLENTYRHIEAGMSPMDAAKVGSQEIGFAIIAMTLCLVAVYVPAGFMHGNIAIFFREFAFTLAASVLISGFVALTLSPMMCARILPDGNHLGRLEKWLNAHFTTWRNAYKKRLSFVIAHRWYLVGLFVVLLAVGAHFFRALPRGLLPKNEIGFVISQISGPGSVNPTYVFNNMKRLMAHVNATPELNKSLHAYASFAGGSGMGGQNSAIALMQLNTGVNASAFAMALSKYMSGMPQVSGGAFVYNMNGGNGLSDKGAVRFAVQGMTSYKQLAVASNLLVNVLKKDPHFRDVESSLHFNTQQYNLHINRALANQLNVPITNITNTLQIYFAGYQLQQEYNYNGVDYPIVMQLPRKKLKDFSVLSSIYVLSRSGNPVKLSRFVTETPDLTIAERSHSQRMRNGVVSLNLNDNYDMGNAVSDIQAAAARVLPGGIEIQFWGAAQKYLQQGSDITLIFVLGLLFIYLVLAALFESFIDPFIILLTVPLCVVGAIIALYIMGGELNLYTGIGLVTLIGLVSKHGVLITQFANARVAEGKSAQDAVVEAAGIRLRPILMTTATMCLGALPLVFASGSGSSGRIQIGVVIVAGLLIGTLFSLFVVPVAYTLFAHIKRQVK